MANFINKYNDNSAYSASAEVTARAALGDTVSLEADTHKLHYDGVNVVVKRPKRGDAVYVPTACAWSGSATPPSGTPEGKAIFVDGDSLDHSKMTTAGYTAVGVVASVRGRKATVLWGASPSAKNFCKNASSSSYQIPTSVFTDEELNNFMVGLTIKDNGGRTSFRSAVSFDLLEAYLIKDGGLNGNAGWSGGSNSDGADNVIFTPYDWGLDYPCPDESADHSTYVSDIAAAKAAYGSDKNGWKRYLVSRQLCYPSRDASNAKSFGTAMDATSLFVSYNEKNGVATDFFPHAQFARNHHETFGSYGQFYNVDGLTRQCWREPDCVEIFEIFKDVTYKLKNKTVNDDKMNKVLNKIGRLDNLVNLVDSSYWSPFLASRGSAWLVNPYGFFTAVNMSSTRRSLSVALLNF